jgi:glycosyltransferase involved in cell wall biosynthesis
MKKVLRIIPTMSPSAGGPPQGIRNITPELDRKGIKTQIITFDSIEEPYLKSESLTINPVGPTNNSLQYIKSFNDKCTAYFRKADVIIIHGLWLYHSYASVKLYDKLFRNSTSKPKLYIIPHGMLDPWFQKDKSRKYKALRNEIYWRLIERKVVNSADAILFTCQRELELARETFRGYKPKKEINIGYGIKQPPAYSASMLTAFTKTLERKVENYFLFFSRIHEKKGLDILIKAYKVLLEENADIYVPNLVIAGPGIESTYGQEVMELVNSTTSLKKKIHFVGMLSGDAKWGAIYGSEAFILPSHQENFGIAVVEALSCSIPVLISDQVNIYKEIERNDAGLISTNNVTGVHKQLSKWLQLSTEEKSSMKSNALKCFEENFQVNNVNEKLVSLFKDNIEN